MLIGYIDIIIDIIDTFTEYQISFTGLAVLVVITVIFRLVAFCCYLRHISVRQYPAIVITPKYSRPWLLLMFTFTGY